MDYGMFSAAGNRAAASIVTGALKLSITTSNDKLYDYLKKRMDKVYLKHSEIYDSEVRDAIISVLERKLHRELTMYF
jgi:flagellar basal body-associated protein FliL